MKSTPFKLLLLSLFGFWMTGLGQYLHERFEHCPPSNSSQIATAGHPVQDGSAFRTDQEGHSHDDCPVCSMLAHMTVSYCAVDVLIALPNEQIATVIILDCPAPVISFEQFPPSRGPPPSV